MKTPLSKYTLHLKTYGPSSAASSVSALWQSSHILFWKSDTLQTSIPLLKHEKYKDSNVLLNNAFRFGPCMLFILSTSALGSKYNKISYFMIIQ